MADDALSTMPFRRKSLMQKVRTGYKHSDTLVHTIGSASAPSLHNIMDTASGPRSVDGAHQDFAIESLTDETCQVGGIVKYINLILQCCVRPNETSGAANNNVGWIEWAVVMVKETETQAPITQLGTQTLGDICTAMYRNECIYTGAIPCGDTLPTVQNIALKVPRSKQRIRIGDEWRLYLYYRDVSSTAMGTDTARVISSVNFKEYL